MITRRQALAAAAAIPVLAAPRILSAQPAWPTRPIRFVVPFAPGGSTDVIARVLGQNLSEILGQPIVVENRAGAGGSTGGDVVARSDPDGYTWLMANSSVLAFNTVLYPKLPYDPLKDFAPVALIATVPNILVCRNGLPVKTTAELIAHAKANPGKLTYSSSGVGGGGHVATAYFASAAGIDILHVPYKGGSPSIAAIVAGQIDFTMTGGPAALPLMRSNQIRGLAVTSTERVPFAPELPPVADAIPNFEAVQWYGLVMPAGTPDAIVSRVNAELTKVLGKPDVAERLVKDGALPSRKTPTEFHAFIKEEIDRWGPVLRNAGITAG